LSIYKAGDMTVYPDDVHNTQQVLDYFTQQDVLQLPDNIELVDREGMDRYFFSFIVFLKKCL
jgi:hypothetical protein